MDRKIFYIASVLIVTKGCLAPVYYVSTNAGMSVRVGYEHLPDMVKNWLDCHNDFHFVLPLVNQNGLSILLVSDSGLN